MPFTFALHIEGVDGSGVSTGGGYSGTPARPLPGYEKWIDVLAWSWGASNSVGPAQLPRTVRQAMKERKKEYFAKHGFDLNGQLLDEEKANALKDDEREALREQFEELEALYEMDEQVPDKFDEPAPRSGMRANVQDISLTKYVGPDSAQIYAMVLAAKKGVTATFRMFKPVPRPVVPKAEDESKMTDDGDESKKADDEEEEEKEPEVDYVCQQEIKMTDVFVTSASTGGSGGEDRLTENITLTFTGIEFKFVDLPPTENEGRRGGASKKKKDATSAAAASSSSSSGARPEYRVKYDQLRKKVEYIGPQ